MSGTVTDLTGLAFDDVTLADQKWMDENGAETMARLSYPCEVEAIGHVYRDGYYGTRVQRVTRDRHAKGIFVGDGGQWRLLALGAAIYPPGGIDALVESVAP